MLVTISNFLNEFGMSGNIPENRILASINEAQSFDLKPVLGDAFFYDIDTKYNTSPADNLIVKLVDGGTYTDCDGNTISFSGLALALKYYALSRFRKKNIINDTNFGVVVKRDNYSDSVDNQTLMTSISDLKASGQGYLNECVKFLIDNKEDYPLFKYNEESIRKPMRITPVARKNNYR